MHNRLLEIIKYATGGHQSDFADKMNWSPQYLYRLLKGEGGIGIKPVISLLETFPELNARWLILGDGAMISTGANELMARLKELLELERFMSVMTVDELRQIKDGKIDFDAETKNKWERFISEQTITNDADERQSGNSE